MFFSQKPTHHFFDHCTNQNFHGASPELPITHFTSPGSHLDFLASCFRVCSAHAVLGSTSEPKQRSWPSPQPRNFTVGPAHRRVTDSQRCVRFEGLPLTLPQKGEVDQGTTGPENPTLYVCHESMCLLMLIYHLWYVCWCLLFLMPICVSLDDDMINCLKVKLYKNSYYNRHVNHAVLGELLPNCTSFWCPRLPKFITFWCPDWLGNPQRYKFVAAVHCGTATLNTRPPIAMGAQY